MTDCEREGRSAKWKKWAQNLLVSSSSDEELDPKIIIGSNNVWKIDTSRPIILRFPYQLVSDESDEEGDYECSIRPSTSFEPSHSKKKRNRFSTSDESSDNTCKEYKNYKHKKRKNNDSKENNTTGKHKSTSQFISTNLNNETYKTFPKKHKKEGSLSNKERKEHNSSHRYREKTNKVLQQSLPDNSSPEKYNCLKNNNKRSVTQKSEKPCSRFLSSSDDSEDVIDCEKAVKPRPSKFKRLRVLSTSSSSSDEGEESNQAKEVVENTYSVQSQSTVSSENQSQALGSTHLKHHLTSSETSDNETDADFVPEKLSSIKTKILTKRKSAHTTPRSTNCNSLPVNKLLNEHAWKNIANVQIRPCNSKASYINQSKIQHLKKQFVSSNLSSVQIYKKIEKRMMTSNTKSTMIKITKKSQLLEQDENNLDNTSIGKSSHNESMGLSIACISNEIENSSHHSDNVKPIYSNEGTSVTEQSLENNSNSSEELTIALEADDALQNHQYESNATEAFECRKKVRQAHIGRCNSVHQQENCLPIQANKKKQKLCLKKDATKNYNNAEVKTQNGSENASIHCDVLGNIISQMENNPYKVQRLPTRKPTKVNAKGNAETFGWFSMGYQSSVFPAPPLSNNGSVDSRGSSLISVKDKPVNDHVTLVQQQNQSNSTDTCKIIQTNNKSHPPIKIKIRNEAGKEKAPHYKATQVVNETPPYVPRSEAFCQKMLERSSSDINPLSSNTTTSSSNSNQLPIYVNKSVEKKIIDKKVPLQNNSVSVIQHNFKRLEEDHRKGPREGVMAFYSADSQDYVCIDTGPKRHTKDSVFDSKSISLPDGSLRSNHISVIKPFNVKTDQDRSTSCLNVGELSQIAIRSPNTAIVKPSSSKQPAIHINQAQEGNSNTDETAITNNNNENSSFSSGVQTTAGPSGENVNARKITRDVKEKGIRIRLGGQEFRLTGTNDNKDISTLCPQQLNSEKSDETSVINSDSYKKTSLDNHNATEIYISLNDTQSVMNTNTLTNPPNSEENDSDDSSSTEDTSTTDSNNSWCLEEKTDESSTEEVNSSINSPEIKSANSSRSNNVPEDNNERINSNNDESETIIILSSSDSEGHDQSSEKTREDSSVKLSNVEINEESKFPKLNTSNPNPIGRIRVRSLQELGVVSHDPLPDNALVPCDTASVSLESNVKTTSEEPLFSSVNSSLNSIQSSNQSDLNDLFRTFTTEAQQSLSESTIGTISTSASQVPLYATIPATKSALSTQIPVSTVTSKINQQRHTTLVVGVPTTIQQIPSSSIGVGSADSQPRPTALPVESATSKQRPTLVLAVGSVDSQTRLTAVPVIESTINQERLTPALAVASENNQPRPTTPSCAMSQKRAVPTLPIASEINQQRSTSALAVLPVINQQKPKPLPTSTTSLNHQISIFTPTIESVMNPQRSGLIAVIRPVGSLPNITNTTTKSSQDTISNNEKQNQESQNIHNEVNPTLTLENVARNNQNVSDSIKSKNPLETDKLFFLLCDELFTEVVYLKIPKLVDDLHLLITFDIMKEERLKKINQLLTSETIATEKRRAEKEFADKIKLHGQGFVPLFMTIINKINTENIKALITALYCKIYNQLVRVDPLHASYKFKLRHIIKEMLQKFSNSVKEEVVSFFNESDSLFISVFIFIENLLNRYEKLLEEREKNSKQNDDVQLEEIIAAESINSKSNLDEISHMKEVKKQRNKQCKKKIENSVCNNILTIPTFSQTVPSATAESAESRSTNNSSQISSPGVPSPVIGNLDQMLFLNRKPSRRTSS